MRKSLLLLMAISVVICLCVGEAPIKKPTVTVDDINVKQMSVTPGVGAKMDLTVRVIVSNPNPVGAHLTKIVYDVYLIDGKEKYLGHGEKFDVDIRKQGDTAIDIPTTLEIDLATVNKIINSLQTQGSFKLKVSGSAYLDLKATTFEIPFEKVKIIALPPPTQPSPARRTSTPTPTVTLTPTPTSTPTEEAKKKLILSVYPNPAKVGQEVTIKVVDENGNPVEGAWVGYIEVGKAIFTGNVIENLKYIGKTDKNGEIKYKFTIPDVYFIGAKKIGYKFNYTKLRVKLLS